MERPKPIENVPTESALEFMSNRPFVKYRNTHRKFWVRGNLIIYEKLEVGRCIENQGVKNAGNKGNDAGAVHTYAYKSVKRAAAPVR